MKAKLHQDVYISIFIFIFVAGMLCLSSNFPGDSAIFPRILAAGMLILNIFIFAGGIKKSKMLQDDEEEVKKQIHFSVIKQPLIVFAIIVLYTILFDFLGYFIATPLLILTMVLFYKVRKWKLIVSVIIVYHIFIYALFIWQLNVPLLN